MRILKIAFNYFLWAITCILMGMLSVRIELGKPPKDATGFLAIFNGLDSFIVFYVGGILGLIAFVFFILINLFYINKQIKAKNKFMFRVSTILILTLSIKVIHYVLEFVLNWI